MIGKYLSGTDVAVILITAALFILALFTKGFTHDLLLEAGVLLVSIKIIMVNYKMISFSQTIIKELKEIKMMLKENKEDK